jgi:hypothetical protein
MEGFCNLWQLQLGVREWGACFDGNNVSKDLLDLEVRYGELIDVEGVHAELAGFGTVEETRMLKKT